MNKKIPYIYLLIFITVAFGLFYNLDDRLLWGDEAETAVLAYNITKWGVPKTTDGKNIITLLGLRQDSNENEIWIWSPWLDEYLAAASFILFGKNTFAARFPFVLVALFTVPFFVFTVRRIYHNPELTLTATLLYVTNVAFLLHSRQCRYYSLIIFAQIWLIFGYQRLMEGHSKKGVFHLICALTIQYYCNYIIVIGNILSLGVSALLVYRRHDRLLRQIFYCFSAFAILAVPWLLYARPWHQSGNVTINNFIDNLIYYFMETHFHIVPLILLLIPLIMFFRKSKTQKTALKFAAVKDVEIFLWMLLPCHMFVLCMLTSIFFRYSIPLIPVLIILVSMILVRFITSRFLRYTLIILLCFSNIISVLSAFPIRGKHQFGMPFFLFLREITSNYQDQLEDVVSFLKDNANSKQSILVADPEFPLIFYTDMRIIDARFKRSSKKIDFPEWIFTESASGVAQGKMRVPDSILRMYQPVMLEVHDTRRGASRPSPHFHVPFTAPNKKKMLLYKRFS